MPLHEIRNNNNKTGQGQLAEAVTALCRVQNGGQEGEGGSSRCEREIFHLLRVICSAPLPLPLLCFGITRWNQSAHAGREGEHRSIAAGSTHL